jgi:hypothetical protein
VNGYTRSALHENMGVLGSGVTAIGSGNKEIESHWIFRVINRYELAGTGDRNKSSLTYNIVAANETSLPYLNASICQYSYHGESSNQVLWLLPITLFIMSAWLFYHGLPQRNCYGFAI